MVRQGLLAILLLLLLTGPVGAVEFYWENTSYSNHWATPLEACWSGQPSAGAYVFEFKVVRDGKNVSGFCRKKRTSDDGFLGTQNFYLRGDSCPTGTVWNEETFSCVCPDGQEKAADGKCVERPPCDTGLELVTRGANSPTSTVAGRLYVLSTPPSAVCSAGCQYISASSKAKSCYLLSGSTDTGFCNYSMTSDGERCSGEDAPGPDVGDPPNPEVPPDSPTQPTDPDDPGCPEGQSWSGDACVAEPTGEGDEGGSDEGEEGEDGDSGDPCDIDGDCWEEGDGGSGSDSGSGSGSGTGNGDNEGTGGGDGEDDGEGECDPSKGYVCGGGKGPESGLNAPDAGSWDKANEEWDQRLDDAKKELKDKVKANVDQMKSAFNLQLSAGGGQLPCDSISVWGKSYRFCVADYGEQLINLRLALLLMAAVIAALIILKE